MSESIFSRRRLLRAAPAAGGLLVGVGAAHSQQTVASVVDVEQNPFFSLQTEEVFNFISDKTQKELSGPKPEETGYNSSIPGKPMPPRQKIVLPGAIERTYHVYRGGSGLHAPTAVTVPVLEEVELELIAFLFIKQSVEADAPKKAAIELAFQSYTPEQDPQVYAAPLLGPAGVTSDMFKVRQSWRLIRIPGGKRTEQVDAENAVKALYGVTPPTPGATSKPVGALPPIERSRIFAGRKRDEIANLSLRQLLQKIELRGEGSLVLRHKEEGLTLKLISEQPLRLLPPPVTSHAMAAANRSDLEGKDGKIQKAITEGLRGTDCGPLGDPLTFELAELYGVPEFKMGGYVKRVKIGCVSTDIWIPQLLYRFQVLTLIGYVNNVQNLDKLIEQKVKECLFVALGSGIIVALVMSDFNSAILTFKVVFHECVVTIKDKVVRCFVPGLALLFRPDGKWRPVV